jgi:hypothetical protein
MTSDDERPVEQLTPESLDTYFRSNVATVHLLSRHPRTELRIDPGAETYELATPAVGAEPELTGLQLVTVDTVDGEDGRWFRLRIAARDLRYEAYGFIVSIVQGMRGGASFAAATAAALTNLRSIIAARQRLSTEQQLGLIGELLVVQRLLGHEAETDVIDWWLGPLAEQHDFAFPTVDVEVKTTTSERRSHLISGTGQLRPNPGRPLWLVSIQLTRAGGADRGVSLGGLVGQVRTHLAARRARFLEYLVGVGWRDADEDLYRDRYLLRSRPAAYPVDDSFPAITPERLAAAVPNSDLVSGVSYRVDVSNRIPADPGAPIGVFLREHGGDLA